MYADEMSFLEVMMRTTGCKEELPIFEAYQTFVILEAITKEAVRQRHRIKRKLELTIGA
jgi:hypothetical protein